MVPHGGLQAKQMKRGWEEIMLESDSVQGVQAIQCFPKMTDWRINNIVFDIHHQLEQLQTWKIQHVYQGANSVAHYLVCWAASEIALGDTPLVFSIFQI